MLRAVILFFILFFATSSGVQAARKISITSDKNILSLDQEMQVMASVSGFTDNEKIYLKGAFYKEGSSNYFGYTKFNDSWIKNSESVKSQREITIGNWDNAIVVKIDYEDAGFIGVGDYKFKLGFYYLTGSGNTSSVNWSENILDLKIDNEPSPTLKPEKTNTSNVTSNANSNVTSNYITATKTNTATPRKNPTNTSVPTKKNTESVKISNVQKEASSYAKIEPITKTNEEKEEEIVQVLGTKDTIFPKVYLAVGIFLLFISAFILIKRELRDRKII